MNTNRGRAALLNMPDYTGPLSGENLGLGYLAGVLRDRGFAVDILDLQRGTLSQAMDRLTDGEYQLVGMSPFRGTVELAYSIARRVKERAPSTLICLGGAFSTFYPEPILADCQAIDVVVIGDGEIPIVDLAYCATAGESPVGVPGTYARSGGGIVFTPHNHQQPASRILPVRDTYHRLRDAYGAERVPARVAGARGCPRACSFCSAPALGPIQGMPKWRVREPDDVVNEIQDLVDNQGARAVMFVDGALEGAGRRGRRRLGDMCRLIQQRGLDHVLFTGFCCCDTMVGDEGWTLAREMLSAGFTSTFVGVESGVQSQLDRYNKAANVAQNRESLELLKSAGLAPVIGFLMFDPYVQMDELRENAAFLTEVGRAHSLLLFAQRLEPLGGAAVTAKLRADGLLEPDWNYKAQFSYRFTDPRVQCVAQTMWELYVSSPEAEELDNMVRSVDVLLHLLRGTRCVLPDTLEACTRQLREVADFNRNLFETCVNQASATGPSGLADQKDLLVAHTARRLKSFRRLNRELRAGWAAARSERRCSRGPRW